MGKKGSSERASDERRGCEVMGVRHCSRNDRAGEPPNKAHRRSSFDEEKRVAPAMLVMNRRERWTSYALKFGGHGHVRVMGKIIAFISEVAPKLQTD